MMDDITERQYEAMKSQVQNRVDDDSYLSIENGRDQSLNSFWFKPLSEETITAIVSVICAFREGELNQNLPIIHIYGGAGRGKSHLARALSRFICREVWQIGRSYLPQSNKAFPHVDWPTFIEKDFRGVDEVESWLDPLMVVERLDAKPPISAQGDTYWLDKFLIRLRRRVEEYGLPTIIVTRRPVDELATFLSMNSLGQIVPGAAMLVAKDIADFIGGNTEFRIEMTGPNFREAIRTKPDFRDKVNKALYEQDLAEYGLHDISSEQMDMFRR